MKSTQKEKSIYITTPIFYVNANPHLGHLHTCFLGDFFSKGFKYFGYRTYFLTGTDEHGQKIYNTAIKSHMTPQQLVDINAQKFINLMKDFHIEYDFFIRTTEEAHRRNVLAIWSSLEKNGYLYRDIYKGLYAERDECFYSLEETYTNELGDTCALATGSVVKEVQEECYFFKLSAFKDKLLEFLQANDFTIPTALSKELINYIKNLKDLCVSRKISWGIQIPGTNETIYVWIDALANYITAIGGIDNYDKELWNNCIHIVGKDISMFHGVYWPAILMALNIKPPKHLLVHGWWLRNQEKMSKSVGNILNPYDINEREYLRYFCLNQNLICYDGDFQLSHFQSIINNELIGKILNLINRTFNIFKQEYGFNEAVAISEWQSRPDIEDLKSNCLKCLEAFSPKNYINCIIEVASDGNKYIEDNRVWKDFNEVHINHLLPLLHTIIEMMAPLLPQTIQKVKTFYKLTRDTFTLYKIETFFSKIDFTE